jgi:hypothetical protein
MKTSKALRASLLAGAGLALGLTLLPTGASAQNWTQITPGRPPTFGYQQPNGNETIITPGQPPTFVYQNPNGATILTPGQPPSFIYQQPSPFRPMQPFGSNPYSNDDE